MKFHHQPWRAPLHHLWQAQAVRTQLSVDRLSVQDISFALTKTGAPCSQNKTSLFARVYIERNGNDFLSAGFSATAASLEGVEVEFIVSLYHAVVDFVCSCSWLYLTCICVSWRRRYRGSHFDTHNPTEVEGRELLHPWWSRVPVSFFVSLRSDHCVVISYPCLFFHKLSIWPLCGTLCWSVFLRISVMTGGTKGSTWGLNLASFLTSFWYEHHVK